jgi:hypothetical protein
MPIPKFIKQSTQVLNDFLIPVEMLLGRWMESHFFWGGGEIYIYNCVLQLTMSVLA